MPIEKFLESPYSQNIATFLAADKYKVESIVLERETMRPHIINTDKATRLIFETHNGSFTQIEQEMKLIIFVWPDNELSQREEVIFEEIDKFRDACSRLFRSLMLNVMRIRFIPLKFKPKDRVVR